MVVGCDVQRRGPCIHGPVGGVFGERELGLELARQPRLDRGIGQPGGRGLQLAGHMQALSIDDDEDFACVLAAEVAQQGFRAPGIVNQLLTILFDQALERPLRLGVHGDTAWHGRPD